MKWNRIVLILSVVAFACLNAPFLMGQTGGGAVVGSVHDPSGAVVPKATVTLTGTETGAALTTQSSSAGEYVFPVVPVGTYTVTVAAPGFAQSQHQNVTVGLNKTVTVDVALQVGAATSTVQVQALASQLETTTSGASTTIDQQTYDNLPIELNGSARSATIVADLMPGVSDTQGNGYGSTGPQAQAFSETINGGQAWTGAVSYDGIPMVAANISGDYRVQPVPVEALQEFSLVQNNFSPEFGHTPGGVLSYSTRAGTNAYHGQAYEYFRNDDLDAAGYFAGSGTKPPLHQNEFGVNVGGPIIIPHVYNGRNKLFFFGFYSGFRLAEGVSPSLTTLPTVAERTGNFTALGRPIYDPTTTSCNAAGVCTRQQYQYNGILNMMPPSSLSQAGTIFSTYLPQPINSNLINNYVAGGVNNSTENRFGGRVDDNIGTRDEIHGFYSGGPLNTENNVFNFIAPVANYGSSISPYYPVLARAGWDHTFSPSVLLHLGFGFNRDLQTNYGIYNNADITYGIANGLPGVTPQLYFNPAVSPYPSTGGSGGGIFAEYAVVENGFLSWTRGKNQFKFGLEFNKNGLNSKSIDSAVDSLVPLETGLPGNASSGDSFASMMAGALDSAVLNDYVAPVDARFKYFAAYFNDDYKMLPNLVLNLGIRYEIPWTRTVNDNVFSSFEPNYPNPGAGGINGALVFQGHGQYGCNCDRFAHTRFVLWQPRVGLAYKLDNKTVIHAGYGLFMSVNGDTNGSWRADGFNATASFSSTNRGITPAMYTANGYPSFTPPPFINPSYDNGGSIDWDPTFAGLPGVVSNYSLNIQRQLPHAFLMDIGYVGNTGQHIASDTLWPQQIPIGYIAEYGATALTSPLSSPLGQATGVPLPYPGFTGNVYSALTTYPQYTNLQVINQNQGDQSYNSLQARLQRQFTNGLSVLASYTWGRIFTNSEAGVGSFNDGPQDAFNPGAEYAPAFTEAPQTFVLSYVYDLPFGYNKKFLNHGLAASLLGGWGVAGIQHYQSGVPEFEMSASNDLPIGNAYLRPDVVPGQPEKASWSGKFNPVTDPYINPNGFTQPPPGQFGNAARNIPLRSFGLYDEALSARKDFHIWESTSLQFRADFFNAFNRTNFFSINEGGQDNPGIPGSGFGYLNGQGNLARSIQFALKLLF